MKHSKKGMLAELLDATCVTGLRRLFPLRGLTILAYHRVLDLGAEESYFADPELVSASRAEFRRQMQYVGAHWNPLPLGEAIGRLIRGEDLPRRSVAITFDDGHIDNYTNAFPILKDVGVPATIFLSTHYVGGTQAFWFDRVATLMCHAPAGSHRLSAPACDLTLGDMRSRRSATEQVLAGLKKLADAQRVSALAELEERFAAHVPAAQESERKALDWDQVREMSRQGITFGSHTVTHPILSTQTVEQIRFELSESRRRIEAETGCDADLLAYPVGKPYAFDQRVVTIARECGYRAAVAYIDGINRPGSCDMFALARTSVERYFPHSMFVCRMEFPRVFT